MSLKDSSSNRPLGMGLMVRKVGVGPRSKEGGGGGTKGLLELLRAPGFCLGWAQPSTGGVYVPVCLSACSWGWEPEALEFRAQICFFQPQTITVTWGWSTSLSGLKFSLFCKINK